MLFTFALLVSEGRKRGKLNRESFQKAAGLPLGRIELDRLRARRR